MFTGVSKQEALMALALFESAMEGTDFMYTIIPFLMSGDVVFSARMTPLGTFLIENSPLLILTLKILTFGILWYGLTSNKGGGNKRILTTWYWIGIILDLAFLPAILGRASIVYYGSVVLYWGISFWLVRCLFWIAATFVLRGFSQEEEPGIFKSEFPAGICQSTSFAKSFLIWEITWYPLVVIGVLISRLVSDYYDYGVAILAMAEIRYWQTTLIYSFLSVASFVTLIGILRGWKLFLTFWIFVYLILGTVLYGEGNWMELGLARRHGDYFGIVLAASSSLLVLTLRVFALVRIFSFAYKTNGVANFDTLQPNEDENSSLLMSPLKISKE